MSGIFVDIALILSLTAVFSAIFSKFKQPLVLSYILVGVFAASSGVFKELTAGDSLDFFAELGIAFALFLIGLELKFSNIRQIGRAAFAVGIGQIIFTTIVGLLILNFLGFHSIEAWILAIALTFSSTIIVVKLLEQKRDLDSLYGKITTGYLIIQDFAAVVALIVIASVGKGEGVASFTMTAASGLFLIGLILILNRFVLQKLFDILAKNTEVLFIAAISWALIFAALSSVLGFSIEIGAFLAGLGLAALREEQQIASWVRPLRNLFVILFFLSLGLHLTFNAFLSVLGVVLIISVFVLIGNPLIMMVIMGLSGFRRRTSFHVALTSAQVSEFSLIFIVLAKRLDLVSSRVVTITTAVALITIVVSTYFMLYSSKMFRVFSPFLKIFERKNPVEKPVLADREFSDHVVLVGTGRLGLNILKSLRKRNTEVVVVDFNPTVVKEIEKMGVPVIYGDMSDPDIFEKALGKNTQMLISTVFDAEDTKFILSELKNTHKSIPAIVTSPTVSLAMDYYKEGASYVIIPRVLSSHLVEKYVIDAKYEELKDGTLRRGHIEELTGYTTADI